MPCILYKIVVMENPNLHILESLTFTGKLSGYVFTIEQGPISQKSRKLFGSEKPFQKLRSAYFKNPAVYYYFKIRKGRFAEKFHS